MECKGEGGGFPQRKGEHHLLSTRSSERGNLPFFNYKTSNHQFHIYVYDISDKPQ